MLDMELCRRVAEAKIKEEHPGQFEYYEERVMGRMLLMYDEQADNMQEDILELHNEKMEQFERAERYKSAIQTVLTDMKTHFLPSINRVGVLENALNCVSQAPTIGAADPRMIGIFDGFTSPARAETKDPKAEQ